MAQTSVTIETENSGNVSRNSNKSSTTITAVVLLLVCFLLVTFTVITIVLVKIPAYEQEASSTWKQCPADYIEKPPVILVSMDAFRASFRERGLTPVLDNLAAEGVSAPYMKPSYPSVTFPNHYSIVTGLYPESHGIIANKFYDPEFNETFKVGSPQSFDAKWWDGEPIWNTLVRQGQKSATFFWPGSDVNISGTFPTYYERYNESVSFEARIDQTIEWVNLPSESRPSLIALYFNEPDHTGHSVGPDSEMMNAMLARMDDVIEYLVTGLENVDLLNCVNLIIVADHGMSSGGPSFVVHLDEYVPNIATLGTSFTGSFARIRLNNNAENLRREVMRNLTCKRPDLRQYEKGGLPTRHHFSNNRRIEDIILDMDVGRFGTVMSNFYNAGTHGYDIYFSTMNAIFVAHGPSFKKGVIVDPFQNIQLYNLMCHLCGVTPAPNNGTAGSLNDVLLNPQLLQDFPKKELPVGASIPDGAALVDRLNVSGCDGDVQVPQAWMNTLNMTKSEELSAKKLHLPWGAPWHGILPVSDLTILYHKDHVTGYSKTLKMPIWTSFTLTRAPEGSALSNWTSDVRLAANESATCNDYKTFDSKSQVIMSPLFHPMFSADAGLAEIPYLVSNAAPSTEPQQLRWRQLLQNLVLRWLGAGELHLVIGPIFDNNADSLADHVAHFQRYPELPSHWFAIVTRCNGGGPIDACNGKLINTRAFMYPTVSSVDNCQEVSEYALEFSGTIKDVEIASDLTFFPDLNQSDRIRLETIVHDQLFHY